MGICPGGLPYLGYVAKIPRGQGGLALSARPMTDPGAVETLVRRVEEALLPELVDVSVDDVQAQMDSYLHPAMDPMSLYRRWEKQQWAVHDLDLSVDVQHWSALDEDTRRIVRRTMTLFFIGEQAV